MKKINIVVDYLQPHSLRPRDDFKRLSAYSFVRLGKAIDANGLLVTYEERENRFYPNWSTAYLQLSNGDHDQNLRHLVNQQISQCLKNHREKVLAFLAGRSEKLSLPPWRPPDWRGSLVIPVDFIQLRNFHSCHSSRWKDGPVWATLRLGHYLTFLKVRVYKGAAGLPEVADRFSLDDQVFKDKRLRRKIEQTILLDQRLREHILRISGQGRGAVEKDFMTTAVDSDPTGQPSPLAFV